MLQLQKFLGGEWSSVRAGLGLDLDHLQEWANNLEQLLLGSATNSLQASAILGDASVVPRYVANTGPNGAPTWDRVDVSSDGIKNRLPYNHLASASTPSLLLGRGSAGPGSGDWEEITLGPNLTMTGTVLDTTAGSSITPAQVAARVSLRV